MLKMTTVLTTELTNITTFSNDVNNTTDASSFEQLGSTTLNPFGPFGALEQYGEFWTAFYINLYYPWLIFAVGVPGNTASFITILRMPPITTSSGYVAALAIIDNMSIVLKLLFHQLTLHNVDIGPGGCQVLYLFGSFFIMYANWILVAMSVERFVAVWFPLKVTTLCEGKKSIAVMTAIAIIIFFVNLQFLWTATDASTEVSEFHCGFKEEHMPFIQYVWYWIDGSLYAIIPCILLILFNILIILGIRRSRKIQKDLTNSKSDQMAETYRQQRQITIMLIVISVVFVALVLPNCLFFIIKSYWIYDSASRGEAIYLLVNQLIFLLSDANHAINFYLYFLTAKRFRRRFRDFLNCKKSARKPFTSIMRTANMSNTSIYTTQTSRNGLNRESENDTSEEYSTTNT